jgi:transitional endoplasmic reticulum ATPase
MLDALTSWQTRFAMIATDDLRLARYTLALYHELSGRRYAVDPGRLARLALRCTDALMVCEDGQPAVLVAGPRLSPCGDMDDDDPFAGFDADSAFGVDAPPDEVQRWLARHAALPSGYRTAIVAELATRPAPPLVRVLGEALRLNAAECELLGFVDSLHQFSDLGNMLRLSPRAVLRVNLTLLAGMLDLTPRECAFALRPSGRLRQLDLLDVASRSDLEDCVQASETCIRIIDAEPDTVDALLALFLEPMPRSTRPLSAFAHAGPGVARVGDALAHACRTGARGVNALFYGAPGTGKTALATALASELDLCAYAVRSADAGGLSLDRRGRLAAFVLAQSLLADRTGCLVVCDEAEDVFYPHGDILAVLSGCAPSRDKGWINHTLEHNPVPTIWISNAVDAMDPAVLRRFLLPLALRIPPRPVRRAMVEQELAASGVSVALLDELAADATFSPALLAAAKRLVDLLPGRDPDVAVRDGVAALRALLQPSSAAPPPRRSVLSPDASLLNLDGAGSAPGLIAALRRSGRGRLCLYGVPGTGKTQFAELLADALGRELLVAGPSTLLSAYVGETERRLAELFRKADPQQHIVLIDEVDGFLSDRRDARQVWERTQVNELLQQMERFDGVFIATTNLIDAIDPAALRRFDLKIGFQPLSAPQRERAFVSALGLPPDQPLAETLRRRLAELNGLTLGDIVSVCRHQAVLGESLPAELFLQRLRNEHAIQHRRAGQPT